MNGITPHLPETWLLRLGGRDASGWLTAFQVDSALAVDDLLWNRFYFGPLNVTERGQLLTGWLEALGDDEGFTPRLDIQLSSWVEANWGRFEQSGVALASAWSCLASVVEFSAKLPPTSRLIKTAGALRDWFPEHKRFLGSFSTAPAADPLGLYLAAVAEFQGDDRSLASFWHRLCEMPDGVPFYHARYALLGLRRLKAANAWEGGSLRAEVVLGLLRLASAFDRLVRERGLAEGLAKTTFRRVASNLAAAYPDSPRWKEHGLAEVMQMPERSQRWVLETIRPLAAALRQEQARANKPHKRPRRSIQPDPTWTVRAREIAEALRRGQVNRLPEIESLLSEQRAYAEATGDTYFIVRSLCNFASRILRLRPESAAQWAEDARAWEPQNAFTWTTTKDVLLKQGSVDRALRFSWVAWKRFPENVVAHNSLAEVLKAAGRLDEAEAVYRETKERFPEDVPTRNGLAELLKAAGRLDEAEAVYRETKERFPENVHARNGLAEVLKVAGRLDEAEEVYRETKERFPENVHARNGLADTFRRARRFSEAEAVLRESIANRHFSEVTYVELAHLLLHQGESGRTEALNMLNESLRIDPQHSGALQLKQKLAHGAAVAAIADELDAAADELFITGVAHEAEVEEEPKDEPPASTAIETEARETSKLEAVSQSASPQAFALTERTLPTAVSIRPRHRPVTDPLERAALLAEASFYRTWAGRSVEAAATQRRQKASELLARAETLTPGDAQVAAERTALECSQAPTETAENRLMKELDKHTASAPLLVQKARLDREKARATQRRLSDATLSELLQAPNRLRALDPALMPVFHLEKGLAALALRDGAIRVEKAAQAFTSFRRTVTHRANEERIDREASRNTRGKKVPRFHEWLQKTTEDRLFRQFHEPAAVAADEVPKLEQTLATNRFLFEEVEDSIVDRLVFAGI